MMLKRLTAAILGLAIVLGACGSGTETATPDSASTPAAGTAQVSTASSELGTILVDGSGLTLYGFTDDVGGVSTCYDDCAAAWPPLTGDLALSAGLDASLFETVARDDGTAQVVAGGFPLYRFVGDGAPGDITGQGSGGVWFAVTNDGALVRDEVQETTAAEDPTTEEGAAAATQVDDTPVLTDTDGFALYAFTNDTAGVSNCNNPCSDTWPPVAAAETITFDALRLTSVARSDGTAQLAVDGRPLYRYAGDEAPGEVNGQLVGGVWFAVGTDGSLIVPAGVRTGSTDAGDVLIDADGFTTYVFGNDEIGISSCYAPCSETWPPVPGDMLIDGSSTDVSQFGTITRDDGTLQLTLAGAPLYTYAGDEFPGDANGRAVGGGVWTTIDASTLTAGNPAEAAPRSIAEAPAKQPAASDDEHGDDEYGDDEYGDDGYGSGNETTTTAPARIDAITVADTGLGQILVDADGITLYGFLNDSDGVSNCNGACADAWPPVPGDTAVDTSVLDGGKFKTIEREDGTTQLAIGKWALYYFAGDAQPGDVNGQGSGDAWFVVAPDGALVR